MTTQRSVAAWYSDNSSGNPTNLDDLSVTTYVQNFYYCCGDFSSAFSLSLFRVAVHNLTALTAARSYCKLQGANDTTNGSDGTWTDIQTFADLPTPSSYPGWCGTGYTFSGLTEYRYYRIYSSVKTTNVVFNEWELWDDIDIPTPIHHWTFDNISGGYAIDEIVDGEDLLITGKTQVSGVFDYGLSGGDTTYKAALAADTAYKSISLWFRRITTTKYGVIICNNAGTGFVGISTDDYVNGYLGGSYNSDLVCNDTEWHHLVITEDTTTSHWFWLDGVKSATTRPSPGNIKYFGRYSFYGTVEQTELDNIQWYNRVITDEEIAFLYEATSQDTTLPIGGLQSYSYASVGGGISGGTSDVIREPSYLATRGAIGGGSAVSSRSTSSAGTGGAVVGGTSEFAVELAGILYSYLIGSGGAIGGGSAATIKVRANYDAFSGAVCGGAAIIALPSGLEVGIVPNAPLTLRIYLSTANGKTLYHVADTVADSYTLTTGRYDDGNICESLFLYPPPPGRIIFFYAGRAYVVDNTGIVWYSEPFSYDRFRLGDSYLQFPDVVDIGLPVKSGIFFAYGNKTDFYAGTPDDGFDITRKFEYGGVYGTGRKIPNTDNVCWQSQRGTVIGTPDGQCKNIQEENVAVDSAVSGSMLLREKDGLRQIIASLQQPSQSKLAAASWIAAEVIRRGA